MGLIASGSNNTLTTMRLLWALSTATLCYAATVGKCGSSACAVSKGTTVQQVFLKQHNYLRQKHQNTPCMTLDSKLNRDATSWAKKMLRKNKMEHASGTGQGENLYMAGMGGDMSEAKVEQHIKAAVDMWYAEIKDYDFKTASKKRGGGAVGHFTQVVWAASTKLGLGYAYGKKSGRNVIYVVGRYSPRGNFHMSGRRKEYYNKNVQRAGCKSPGGEASVAAAEKKSPSAKGKPCPHAERLRKARESKAKKAKKQKKRKSKKSRKRKSKKSSKRKSKKSKKRKSKKSTAVKRRPCPHAERLRKARAEKAKSKKSPVVKKKPCKHAKALRKTRASKAKKPKTHRLCLFVSRVSFVGYECAEYVKIPSCYTDCRNHVHAGNNAAVTYYSNGLYLLK